MAAGRVALIANDTARVDDAGATFNVTGARFECNLLALMDLSGSFHRLLPPEEIVDKPDNSGLPVNLPRDDS